MAAIRGRLRKISFLILLGFENTHEKVYLSNNAGSIVVLELTMRIKSWVFLSRNKPLYHVQYVEEVHRENPIVPSCRLLLPWRKGVGDVQGG